MTESNAHVSLVLTTTAGSDEAARLGRTLVEERLAACATLVPGAQSIFRWKDAIESSAETLLLLKTVPGRLAALEARLHELHSYETPEFLVLEGNAASEKYLAWLRASVKLE